MHVRRISCSIRGGARVTYTKRRAENGSHSLNRKSQCNSSTLWSGYFTLLPRRNLSSCLVLGLRLDLACGVQGYTPFLTFSFMSRGNE